MGHKKRRVLGIRLAPALHQALEEIVQKDFPLEKTAAGFVRRILHETVSSFLTDQELRERGLLTDYDSVKAPTLLLHILSKGKERRQGLPEVAGHPDQNNG